MVLERDKRYQTSASVRFEKYGSGEAGDVYMKNLSSSGARFMLFSMDTELKAGDIIRFTVSLPELRRERVVSAQIVWRTEQDFGVSFIKPDDLWQRLIEVAR